MTTPGVFSAFAAVGSLTSLQQSMSADLPPAAVCAALGTVSSLRSLHFEDNRSSRFHSGSRPVRWRETAPVMPPALVGALQQLPQLHALHTETPMHPAQLQLLPQSLNELSVILRPTQDDADSMQPDLRHLTALTSLALQCAVPLSAQTGFPDSLLSLCVEGACHAVCGTRLQSLKLSVPHLCMELVLQMQHLPALRDFAFVEVYSRHDSPEEPTVPGMTAVVVALAAATQLTALTFSYSASTGHRQGFALLPVAAFLEGMQNLEHLQIQAGSSTEADLIKLTALTRLTNLKFGYYGDAELDLVVAALAVRLQRLQVLHLEGGCIDCPSVLAPIGALPELKQLKMQESGLTTTDPGLMQLSTLTQLTCLYLGEKDLVC